VGGNTLAILADFRVLYPAATWPILPGWWFSTRRELPILPLFEHLATRDVADLAVFAGMSMSAMPRFVPILPQFAFAPRL
jgi:hypothetical protein